MPVIERRNILLCLFDSLSAFDSGVHDGFKALPALSGVLRDGATFTRVYTPCPESSPARASLFTGLDPCVHGLWTDGVTLSEHEQTFPQLFAQAGYSNYLSGRYHLSGVSRWTTEPIRRAEFSKIDWAHGPLHRSRQNAYLNWLKEEAPELNSTIFTSQPNPDQTQITQQQKYAVEALPDKLSFNHWVGTQAGKWIESHPTETPFLAIAGFSVGDLLGTEPESSSNGEALNKLALRQADDAVGRILEQLRASNRLEDTIVIVAADRGNAVSDETENIMSERAIRVPLLIYNAGYKKQAINKVISTIDIAPTILALANITVGPRMQGRSLLSLLDGTEAPRGWALSRLRKPSLKGNRQWHTSFCSDDMKLVLSHGEAENQQQMMYLFNLDDDPLEQNNLAKLDAHSTDLEHMTDQMIDARCALEDRTEPRIAEF